ncbi:MAG: FAD-linked oxidase C-terminal domain-containing protein, partial [Marinirhabdus sp.]|nr:FAD-linked oxidase C-terminal domain-containing protein [Marinirhabdus sp.]
KAGLGLLGNMVGDNKAVACIEDTAVALSDLPAFIAEFTAIMEAHKQKAVYYAHAGAGELHLRPILNLKTKKGVGLFREITTEVAALTKKYKGSFSGEHGDGIVRAEFLKMQIGASNFELLKRIKKRFDPNNIFNPGKITDAWPMDESLRTDTKTPEISTKFDFSDSQGIVRLAEKCNGSGDCRKTELSAGAMCPSYHATRDEKDTTRARANMLREVLTQNQAPNAFNSEALKEAFSLCISCKACASECPSNVDMATAKSEFQYQYAKSNGRSKSDLFVANSTKYNRMAYRFPKLANVFLQQRWLVSILKKRANIAAKRSMPEISTKRLDKVIYKPIKEAVVKRKVYLFVDEFSHYLDIEIVFDSIQLLTHLGYEVEVLTEYDSARALLSKGFLEEATKEINRTVAAFQDIITAQTPLVGIEPSAILGFRDEFPRLATHKEKAKKLGAHCFLIEEFISAEIRKGVIVSDQFTSEEKHIKVHVHCHQKALSDQKITFDMLNLPKNYKPTLIPSGCCGMAGSFGYEKEHYETSMKIGELRLFPAVRKASIDTIIAANGTSCRHQIKDGTQRKALHPVTILKEALLPLKD